MKQVLVREHCASCVIEFEDYYMFIIYTPNLGWETAVLGWDREQGGFKGATREQGA